MCECPSTGKRHVSEKWVIISGIGYRYAEHEVWPSAIAGDGNQLDCREKAFIVRDETCMAHSEVSVKVR